MLSVFKVVLATGSYLTSEAVGAVLPAFFLAQTKSEAKRLRSSTNFCHHVFVHEENPITIASVAKPDSCF